MGRSIAVFAFLILLSVGSTALGQSYVSGSSFSSPYSSTSSMSFQRRDVSLGGTRLSSGLGPSSSSSSSSGFLPSDSFAGSVSQGLDGRQATQNPYGEGNPFPPGTPPNPYGFYGIVSGYR